MPIDTKGLRRSYEAAVKDRTGQRFFAELKEGFDKKEIVPKDFSLRELFEEFIPDGRELVDSWSPRRGGGGYVLSELIEADAVKTTAFTNISGQIVYNEVLAGFQAEDFLFSRIIPVTNTQFSGEKIAGIGAIGDLAEVVAEAQAYPMVGVQEDWISTPETVKRGLIVPVTREAIFFDRTGQLLKQARDVGLALGYSREKRAVDCVIDENTTAHRYNRRGWGVQATYAANSGDHNWANLQTTNGLVNWTDVDAAEQLLNAITDPNTSEPIVLTARHLVCTKQNERVALAIRNATEVGQHAGGYATSGTLYETRFANPVGGAFEVLCTRYVADRAATDTDWWYGDVTVAFRYMQNWPLSTVQAPPNSELEFTQDIAMRWKASERGAFATIEPRAMVENTA